MDKLPTAFVAINGLMYADVQHYLLDEPMENLHNQRVIHAKKQDAFIRQWRKSYEPPSFALTIT